MQVFFPWIGGLAALLTSLSYIPQVQKAWPRGSTKDLSVKMLAVLTRLGFLDRLRVPQGRLGNHPGQQRRSGPVGDGPVLQAPGHEPQLSKVDFRKYPPVCKAIIRLATEAF